MKAIKYIAIDLASIFSFFILILLLPYPDENYTWPLWALSLAIICLFVGVFFEKGHLHGLSIGVELIAIYILILYLIGKPGIPVPLSEIVTFQIIIPLLPAFIVGPFFGFMGTKIKQMKKAKLRT